MEKLCELPKYKHSKLAAEPGLDIRSLDHYLVGFLLHSTRKLLCRVSNPTNLPTLYSSLPLELGDCGYRRKHPWLYSLICLGHHNE